MLEQIILLNIDLMYYEFKFIKEQIPIKKYYYWNVCRKIEKLIKENEHV